ncbi:MAG: SDR family NAD(P)-dependent oxidoreductase [Myxococcales bacterium]|jgi:NAD(P)-dependent dehydrogenase (short-subunit alcohol dehydrogenase family)|nr:MAG: SDR family NAD(P)-dependent oxidoreductase [Myxococcales bacterium]
MLAAVRPRSTRRGPRNTLAAMKDLEGKTAVVIGGGSGIGRGIALAAAAERMAVAVADIDADAARSVAAEIRDGGGEATTHATDATDRAALETLADAVVERFGAADLLSNNAGVTFECPLVEASLDDWQWVMEFNLYTAVNACTVFAPCMREQGGGHIVNNASLAGLAVFEGLGIGLYTTSKFALIAYSEMLRTELEDDDVGVSVLCPSMTRSNLAKTSARNRPPRFGGPLRGPAGGMPDIPAEQMMAPEEVGRIALRGVADNRLFILTHPEMLPAVVGRFRQIARDCLDPGDSAVDS